MQPSSGDQQRPLTAAVSAELARLEEEVGQAADPVARARLADLGEAAAISVLRRAWEERHAVRSLSAYINNAPGLDIHCAVNDAARQQEEPISGDSDVQLEIQIPGQQTPCRLQNEERTTASVVADLMDVDGKEVEGSPRGWIWISADGLQNHEPPSSTVYSSVSNRERAEAGYLEYQMPNDPAQDLTLSPVSDITMRVQEMGGLSGRVGVTTPPSLTRNALRATVSPQMLALGELEFHRRFLIFVYLADKKIEEVLEDVNYIRYLKSMPMDCFESEIWNKFGKKYVPAADRRKNLDWDPSKTRLYYCNVETRHDSIVTSFKGPYIDNKRTYLQKIVGDDNILIVKFADIPGLRNSADNFGMSCMFYRQVAEDGILLGLRRYRFFMKYYHARRLSRRGLPCPERCPLCDQEQETINHLLVSCSFARQYWYSLLCQVGLQQLAPQASDVVFDDWWDRLWHATPEQLKKGLNSMVVLGAWVLWTHRNSCVFDGANPSITRALSVTSEERHLWEIAGARSLSSLTTPALSS